MPLHMISDETEFNKIIEENKMVALVLCAQDKLNCKTLLDKLNPLANEYSNIELCYTDIDTVKSILDDYNVSMVPHFLTFYQGSIHQQYKGGKLDRLKVLISKLLLYDKRLSDKNDSTFSKSNVSSLKNASKMSNKGKYSNLSMGNKNSNLSMGNRKMSLMDGKGNSSLSNPMSKPNSMKIGKEKFPFASKRFPIDNFTFLEGSPKGFEADHSYRQSSYNRLSKSINDKSLSRRSFFGSNRKSVRNSIGTLPMTPDVLSGRRNSIITVDRRTSRSYSELPNIYNNPMRESDESLMMVDNPQRPCCKVL